MQASDQRLMPLGTGMLPLCHGNRPETVRLTMRVRVMASLAQFCPFGGESPAGRAARTSVDDY